MLDDTARSQGRDTYEHHLIIRASLNARPTPQYSMPLGDRLDGVSLCTDPWLGTTIPATSPLRSTSVRRSDFCKLLSIVQSV